MPRCCCCCCGNTNNDTNTGGSPVGTVIYAHVLQPGYVKANGQLLSRRDFPELYKYASENNLVLSESDWANEMQGMFAEGDGVNTFRIPDLRGQFLRALDDGAGMDADRILGSLQEDAIRNIKGSIGVRQSSDRSGSDLGPFSANNRYAGVSMSQELFPYLDGFDVSRVVPTAEENRPKNVALIAQIKY